MQGNIQKIVASLVLAALILAELFHVSSAPPPEETIRCENLLQGCHITLPSQTLQVKFSTAPNALKPFDLEVTAPAARGIHASLTMPGMEMGPNRYRLIAAGTGVWRAQVMLPVCVTGRRDWVLLLEVDRARVRVPFSAGKERLSREMRLPCSGG